MSAETFDAAWLALREPTDHASRSEELTDRLAEWWALRRRSAVLDLGSGTGSNMRYLAPRLPGPQSWTLIDHDPDLLARAGTPSGDVTVRTIQGDLGDLGEEGLTEIAGASVVTGSALLDLVSERWIEALVDACAGAGCGALFALTYDGMIDWTGSSEPVDEVVRAAVNAHQRRDKGFGAALGPAAAGFAEQTFRRRGYRTWTAPSPWRLSSGEAELGRALLAGWSNAAAEERPEAADRIRAWADRRRTTLAGGDFRLTVGHIDLLALPEG